MFRGEQETPFNFQNCSHFRTAVIIALVTQAFADNDSRLHKCTFDGHGVHIIDRHNVTLYF